MFFTQPQRQPRTQTQPQRQTLEKCYVLLSFMPFSKDK